MGFDVLSLLLILGCSTPSIQPEYDKAAAAVATAAPLPAIWEPDMRLRVSRKTIAKLAGQELDKLGAIHKALKVSLLKATPTVRLEAATIAKRAPACGPCVPLDIRFGGNVRVQGPFLDETWSATATAKVDVEVLTTEAKGLWEITARPRRVSGLTLEVPALPPLIAPTVSEPLRNLLEAQIESQLKPIPIAKLKTKELPLLAARVTSDAKGVVAELRTASPTPGTLTGTANLGKMDAVLEIATPSLLGLVAQKSFAHGPVAEGIVPELRGLEVSKGALAADLRLWHPGQPSWWRDYGVTGTATFDKQSLALAASDVQPTGASKGAALADPLVALGQALLLDQIVGYLAVALPTQHNAVVANKTASFELTALSGRPDAVVVRANLTELR